MRVIALASLLAVVAIAGAADDTRDLIVDKKGKKTACTIISEMSDKLTFRFGADSPEKSVKWVEVARVEYVEQRGGAWTTAQDARDRGKYDEAAILFEQVASGPREWQKAYGSFAQGDVLELAHKYAEAAEAFAHLDQLPKHRLWLDAKYRQGFCLALAKKQAEAKKIADDLSAYAKANTMTQAETRANAVRAAIAAAAGDVAGLQKNQAAARFSAVSEPTEWFHFALFYADSLRGLGKGKDAATEYRQLAAALDNDPVRRVSASFGYGLSLVDTDKQSALIELIKLDALPYGSAAQKCEARFVAGRLLWEESKTGLADPEAAKDEKRLAFFKANARTARAMLAAAAASTEDIPAKSGARQLLEQIGPDADEKSAKDPSDHGDAKAAKPAKGDNAAQGGADK